jgi:tetratricopeptide (TPR) repeat protein
MGGLAPGMHVEQSALYYQGLALEKLGEADRAKAVFTQLVVAGDKQLASAPQAGASDASQLADAHYMVGLGQLGLDHQDKAKQEFSLALKASPDHYAAMRALNGMM